MPWWFLEILFRLDPRLEWKDIDVLLEHVGKRQRQPNRQKYINSFNNICARGRADWMMVSWREKSKVNASNKTRDHVLDGLSQQQKLMNTTRGSTPGLNLAGNRVPVPTRQRRGNPGKGAASRQASVSVAGPSNRDPPRPASRRPRANNTTAPSRHDESDDVSGSVNPHPGPLPELASNPVRRRRFAEYQEDDFPSDFVEPQCGLGPDPNRSHGQASSSHQHNEGALGSLSNHNSNLYIKRALGVEQAEQSRKKRRVDDTALFEDAQVNSQPRFREPVQPSRLHQRQERALAPLPSGDRSENGKRRLDPESQEQLNKRRRFQEIGKLHHALQDAVSGQSVQMRPSGWQPTLPKTSTYHRPRHAESVQTRRANRPAPCATSSSLNVTTPDNYPEVTQQSAEAQSWYPANVDLGLGLYNPIGLEGTQGSLPNDDWSYGARIQGFGSSLQTSAEQLDEVELEQGIRSNANNGIVPYISDTTPQVGDQLQTNTEQSWDENPLFDPGLDFQADAFGPFDLQNDGQDNFSIGPPDSALYQQQTIQPEVTNHPFLQDDVLDVLNPAAASGSSALGDHGYQALGPQDFQLAGEQAGANQEPQDVFAGYSFDDVNGAIVWDAPPMRPRDNPLPSLPSWESGTWLGDEGINVGSQPSLQPHLPHQAEVGAPDGYPGVPMDPSSSNSPWRFIDFHDSGIQMDAHSPDDAE